MKKECSSCSKEPTGRINVARFINTLDAHFKVNDLDSAVSTVEYWEKEAAALGDIRGLLSVLNEQLGLFRRLGDKEKALRAADKVIENLEGALTKSESVILVNLATTLKAFGFAEKALPYYEKAEELLDKDSYEYASALNNKSSSLIDLNRLDEAEDCLNKAIEILKAEGRHDADIALSLLNLAHLTFDRDNTAYNKCEALLDEAWEYINSPRTVRNSEYAFAISKCVPSLRYFKRGIYADALEEVANEIYGG